MTEAFSMRTVLLVAACTLCLAFAAHGAEPADASAQRPAASLPVSPSAPQDSDGCIHAHAMIGKTAFNPAEDAESTDDDAANDNPVCCATSSYCAQFLSTQALLKPPIRART
jgi:hypothetical protein